MIIQADLSHKEQITELWSNAFGDSIENVNNYLETLLKYFFVYEDSGIIKGMLSVLPVSYKNKKGGYIYAVVTHPGYRGQGICNSLIKFVKENTKYDFLVLVPQNQELYNFYSKMDFVPVSLFCFKKEFVKKKSNHCFKMKRITVKEYEKARNEYFSGDLFEWDAEILSFAKKMYGGDFYEIETEYEKGFAFLYKEKNTVIIKDFLIENYEEVANMIGLKLDCESVIFSYSDENKESYMIYPENFDKRYFSIYLD